MNHVIMTNHILLCYVDNHISYGLGLSNWISNLVRTTRFWNNLHQVRSIYKYWKA